MRFIYAVCLLSVVCGFSTDQLRDRHQWANETVWLAASAAGDHVSGSYDFCEPEFQWRKSEENGHKYTWQGFPETWSPDLVDACALVVFGTDW